MKVQKAVHVRLVAIFLTLAVMITSSPVVFASDQDNNLPMQSSVLDPNTGTYLPVVDARDDFAAITEVTPRDTTFEKKFSAQQKGNLTSRSSGNLPIPGGVGYGMYFTPAFQNSFTQGTNIAYDIICPRKAGGNVTDYLYLTSTNRAAKGVEAFVLYKGQDDFMFKIYDWARPEDDRWPISIPYSNMSKYIRTKDVNGTSRPFITVQSTTEQTGINQWTNSVWLGTATGYDFVYSYTYTSTLAQQRDSHYGSWGPIVETFQNSYSNINPMGFSATQLRGRSSSAWGSFGFLTASQSTIRNDQQGFKISLISPNYAFLVS